MAFKGYNNYNLGITGHSAPTLVQHPLCPLCEPGESWTDGAPQKNPSLACVSTSVTITQPLTETTSRHGRSSQTQPQS